MPSFQSALNKKSTWKFFQVKRAITKKMINKNKNETKSRIISCNIENHLTT